MRLGDAVFWSAIFFLLGVLLVSLGQSVYLATFFVFILFLTALIFRALKKPRYKMMAAAGWLSIFILAGFFYCYFFASLHKEKIVFNKRIVFDGLIVSEPELKEKSQHFLIKLASPLAGEAEIYSAPHPRWRYGDLVRFSGEIEKSENGQNICGFPQMTLIEKNQASPLKFSLLSLKSSLTDKLNKVLPPSSAALINGLLFGDKSGFSEKMSEALIKTGTIHMVALSGYNILIIISAVQTLFSYVSSRRKSFYFTFFIIGFFVLATGAEASAVRAAIMGGLVLLAKESSRLYNARNSIAITALAMTVFNPRLLAYDVGFELSFMALLGIIYLEPWLKKHLKIIGEGEGVLGWRKNFFTTTSAQLAVLPILIVRFGRFSWFSIAPNILILEAIPLTMFFGFLTAAAGLVSLPLAQLVGMALNPFLSYEIGVISIFARVF